MFALLQSLDFFLKAMGSHENVLNQKNVEGSIKKNKQKQTVMTKETEPERSRLQVGDLQMLLWKCRIFTGKILGSERGQRGVDKSELPKT